MQKKHLLSKLAADEQLLADAQGVGEGFDCVRGPLRRGFQLVQPPRLQRDAHSLLELPIPVAPAFAITACQVMAEIDDLMRSAPHSHELAIHVAPAFATTACQVMAEINDLMCSAPHPQPPRLRRPGRRAVASSQRGQY